MEDKTIGALMIFLASFWLTLIDWKIAVGVLIMIIGFKLLINK